MYRTLPGIRKYSKTGQKDSCNAYISHICSVEEKNKNLLDTAAYVRLSDEFDDMCYLIQKMKGEHEIWQG